MHVCVRREPEGDSDVRAGAAEQAGPNKKTVYDAHKFDLNKHLAGSLGLYRGQEDYEIVLELDAWAADDVRGRRLHSSQELTELPKGMLRVRLRLNSLEEVERWVLSMGAHATVIRPDKLRERLQKAAAEVSKGYAEGLD